MRETWRHCVSKANILTTSLEISRPDTQCPADPEMKHCHCSAKQHKCHRCGNSW